MKINRSSQFKRSFKKLSTKIKRDFEQKIKIFFNDPFSPSLHTHKLKGNLADYYSFYLKNGHRVLFDFEAENTVILVNVGSHDDYNKWGR